MKFDLRDGALVAGVAMAGAGLWLLHPYAFYGGMALFGVFLIRRSLG